MTINYPLPYYDSDGTLIFLHIPKTGGMSLRTLLGLQFPDEQIYDMDSRNPHGSFQRFQELPEEYRRKIRLISGHQPFGLHEFIPSTSTYLTFLRDPVERVLSFYSYAKEHATHPLHGEINRLGMGIDDLMRSEHAPQLRNVQTCHVSGRGLNDPQEALEWAKHHLRFHFCAVGIMERYGESIALLRNALGLAQVSIPSVNRTRNRMQAQELPKETRDLIRDANTLDQELYQFAVELFELRVRAQGPNFHRDVEQVVNGGADSPQESESGFLRRFLGRLS